MIRPAGRNIVGVRDILLSGSHLFIDETEVRVLDPGRGRT
jgi:hypothetical protein